MDLAHCDRLENISPEKKAPDVIISGAFYNYWLVLNFFGSELMYISFP